MSSDFYSSLLLFIALFLVTIALVFLQKSKRKKSNLYLGSFFIILGSSIFFRFLEITNLVMHFPHLIELDFPFCFLLAPLYLFFVKTYIFSDIITSKEKKLHCIPALLAILFLAPIYFLNSAEKTLYINEQTHNSFSWRYQILNGAFFTQTLAYLIFILLLLRKKSNQDERNNTKWVRFFTVLLLSIQLITFLSIPFVASNRKFDYTPIMGVCILLLILIWALQKSEILLEEKSLSIDEIKVKYKDSTLTNQEIEKHAFFINDLIQTKQLFLTNGISLISLAEEANLPARTISEVINRHFSCSFNDYINGFRVTYCKELLIEKSAQLTIDSIAEAAGFTSRASFYNNFKKLSGLSPTEYIKMHKKD